MAPLVQICLHSIPPHNGAQTTAITLVGQPFPGGSTLGGALWSESALSEAMGSKGFRQSYNGARNTLPNLAFPNLSIYLAEEGIGLSTDLKVNVHSLALQCSPNNSTKQKLK